VGFYLRKGDHWCLDPFKGPISLHSNQTRAKVSVEQLGRKENAIGAVMLRLFPWPYCVQALLSPRFVILFSKEGEVDNGLGCGK